MSENLQNLYPPKILAEHLSRVLLYTFPQFLKLSILKKSTKVLRAKSHKKTYVSYIFTNNIRKIILTIFHFFMKVKLTPNIIDSKII